MASIGSRVAAAQRRVPARVLIVDDSSIARAVLGHGLKAAGMHVDEARGGAEALAILAASSYDVVLTDLCMPGMDGFALLAGIKKQTPATEVIVLSGFDDLDRATQAVKLGAHAFLAKPPAHPDEVLLTVQSALGTLPQRVSPSPRAVAH